MLGEKLGSENEAEAHLFPDLFLVRRESCPTGKQDPLVSFVMRAQLQKYAGKLKCSLQLSSNFNKK